MSDFEMVVTIIAAQLLMFYIGYTFGRYMR
jgi:hypothetical protein